MLLTILGTLIIIGLVYWAANALMTAFGVGEPVRTVVIVALAIVCILRILSLWGANPLVGLTTP